MTGFSPPPPPPPLVAKAPRPSVTVGAALLAAGGALMIVGSVLKWFDLDGVMFNGFTTGLDDFTNVKGGLFAVVGVLCLAFGVAQLVGKKVLALGILGAVISAFGLLVGLKALSDVNDLVDFGRLFGANVSTGPGLYVAVAGALVAIVGSIATVAKQRA